MSICLLLLSRLGRRPEVPSEPQYSACVLYEYITDERDELSLEVGQVIQIFGDAEPGWLHAKIGEATGVVPKSFVKRLPRVPRKLAKTYKSDNGDGDI